MVSVGRHDLVCIVRDSRIPRLRRCGMLQDRVCPNGAVRSLCVIALVPPVEARIDSKNMSLCPLFILVAHPTSSTMPSRRRLQQYAIAVSIFSLFYNTAEGAVSIVFGAESSSRALVFYGLQSAVEVISDFLVTWRFLGVRNSGDEIESIDKTSPQIIR